MKRVSKKFLSIVLTMVMAFSVTACGKAKGDADKMGVQVEQPAETTKEEPADTQGTQNTQDAQGSTESNSEEIDAAQIEEDTGSFKIGMLANLSKKGKEMGEELKNGAELAVEEINAAGGIGGRMIEFQAKDSKRSDAAAQKAYEGLKAWGAQMLVGGMDETETQRFADLTSGDNMFLMLPASSFFDGAYYSNVYQLELSGKTQGKMMADYIEKKRLADRVAVIYNAEDVYSLNTYQEFSNEAEFKNFEICSAMPYGAGAGSAREALEAAKAAGANLLILPVDGEETLKLLKQAAKMDYHPLCLGSTQTSDLLTKENVDFSICEGLMFFNSYLPNSTGYMDTAIADFEAAYEEKYGQKPDVHAAEGYDSIYALKFAAERSGVLSTMDVQTICTQFVENMSAVEMNGLTGTDMKWGTDGSVEKDFKVIQIENGTVVVKE